LCFSRTVSFLLFPPVRFFRRRAGTLLEFDFFRMESEKLDF
jgi:hypothetical protein